MGRGAGSFQWPDRGAGAGERQHRGLRRLLELAAGVVLAGRRVHP